LFGRVRVKNGVVAERLLYGGIGFCVSVAGFY
jgi:hypothetical protein